VTGHVGIQKNKFRQRQDISDLSYFSDFDRVLPIETLIGHPWARLAFPSVRNATPRAGMSHIEFGNVSRFSFPRDAPSHDIEFSGGDRNCTRT
jgi:hypothetical protein